MKAGDLVRVTALPVRLPENPETKEVFQRCVGRTFPVLKVAADGQIELEVGEVMGVLACLHWICIEPECVELVRAAS